MSLLNLKDSVTSVTDGNINMGPSIAVNSAHLAPEKFLDEKIDDVEEIKKKLKILVVFICVCVYNIYLYTAIMYNMYRT